MSDSPCTCPPADPDASTREGDKDCPTHGLDALAREMDSLSLYVFPDGRKCFAPCQVDADRWHVRTTPVTA